VKPFSFLLLLLSLAWTLPLDAEEAATLFDRAVAFETGQGAPRDYGHAFRLYCMAARQGETEAYYALGWMFFTGRGVARDMEKAALWFQRGAQAGDRTAANMARRLGIEEPAPADEGCPPLLTRKRVTPELIEHWVRLLAPEFDLDPELVLAVIAVESNFNPSARSPKGALGLMQLIPETARRFGVKDPLDPLQNLRGGMAYLAWLRERFDGNLPLMLAGYNAGENAVDRYQGVPPYRETQEYVKRITRRYGTDQLKKTRSSARLPVATHGS